jgi:hypothetical protein
MAKWYDAVAVGGKSEPENRRYRRITRCTVVGSSPRIQNDGDDAWSGLSARRRDDQSPIAAPLRQPTANAMTNTSIDVMITPPS